MAAKKKSYKIKYVGNSPKTEVIGLGVFEKEKEVTFEDQDQIEKAKHLVKSNVNFKEVQ